LLAYVKEPVTNLNPKKNEEVKLVEAAIWVAINRLAQFS
jgi:hypothetical protein